MYSELTTSESEELKGLNLDSYDVEILYSDKYVDRLVIHKYYFPRQKDIVVYFSQIQSLRTNIELHLRIIDYKGWGYGCNDIWWAVDMRREHGFCKKPLCLVATVFGEYSKKGFTVERPEECINLLNNYSQLLVTHLLANHEESNTSNYEK